MNRDSQRSPISQDDRVEYLESQVEAFKARCSILQQQQVAAIDALDNMVLEHTRELEVESKIKLRLEHALRKSEEAHQEIERDRDDLRGAVLELIEKVENTHNNFNSWPYSRLQVSSHTESSRTQEAWEQLGYASGIIRSLKEELSSERQAHSLTRSRVHTLEAQVAARDAALEKWVQQADASAAPTTIQNVNRGVKKSTKGKKPEVQRDLDRAEISSLYEQTQAKNRKLEEEVRGLFRNLERARSRTEKPVLHLPISPSPLSLSPLLPARDTSISLTSTPDRPRSEPRTPPRRHVHSRSPSFQQGPSTARNLTQGDVQNLAGPSKVRSSSRPRIRTPSPIHRPLSPLDVFRTPLHPTSSSTVISIEDAQNEHTPRLRPHSRTSSRRQPTFGSPLTATADPPPQTTMSMVHRDLDEQIRLLSAQIDAFRAERLELLHIIQTQLRDKDAATLPPEIPPENPSEHDIHDSPGASPVVLEEEPVAAGGRAAGEQVDDETDGGERSMDLETPLLAALVSLPGDTNFQSTHVSGVGSPAYGGGSEHHYDDDPAAHELEGLDMRGLRVTPPNAGNEYEQGVQEIRMVRPRVNDGAASPSPP